MTRRHKPGVDRQAASSLPACLDDCVGSENPVRAVDAYVDRLDLLALGFARLEANPTAAGQPAFPPSALLKLYLYGYLNRVRSSRGLEKECQRNLEVIWLLRGLKPGYRTIADFRRRNAEALGRVHAELTARCREWRLTGGRVAVDGSHFNGNVSDKSFRSVARLEREVRRLGERLEALEAEERAAREGDRDEGGSARQEERRALEAQKEAKEGLLKTLEAAGETQVSRTDPDARLLRKRGQTTAGYNVQIVVDARHKLIVADEVVQDGNDLHQLHPMLSRAKAALGAERLEGEADKGYYNLAQIAQCEADGITAYVPEPDSQARQRRGGRHPHEAFRYLPEEDAYQCPAGRRLRRSGPPRQQPGGAIQRYAGSETDCRQCPQRDPCITAKAACREVWRHEHEAQRLALRQRMAGRPDAMRHRSATVEHPFGTLKCRAGWNHFLVRGLDKVRGEWSLMALAYNFSRVLNILGGGVFTGGGSQFQSATAAA